MTPSIIAHLLFWVTLVCAAIFVYQAVILPGIRLSLRYRVFALRDTLRNLVIEGRLTEYDPAFQILHDRLNFLCVSLHRFDLARVVQASHNLDDESRARVERSINTIKAAPAEVQQVYKESLEVIGCALAVNSLLFFLVLSIAFLLVLSLQSIYKTVKTTSLQSVLSIRELFQKRVGDDSAVALFSPELATV